MYPHMSGINLLYRVFLFMAYQIHPSHQIRNIRTFHPQNPGQFQTLRDHLMLRPSKWAVGFGGHLPTPPGTNSFWLQQSSGTSSHSFQIQLGTPHVKFQQTRTTTNTEPASRHRTNGHRGPGSTEPTNDPTHSHHKHHPLKVILPPITSFVQTNHPVQNTHPVQTNHRVQTNLSMQNNPSVGTYPSVESRCRDHYYSRPTTSGHLNQLENLITYIGDCYQHGIPSNSNMETQALDTSDIDWNNLRPLNCWESAIHKYQPSSRSQCHH